MEKLLIGGADHEQLAWQLGKLSNRHGLITGATGSGKTVTLQVLAEGFARMGVPVFATDVKGDLAGLGAAGKPHAEIDRRVELLNLTDYEQAPCSVTLWDVFGKNGHPVRVTISEMGPMILASLLRLNDVQTGVLYAAFSIADDQGLLLLDLKDLRSLLTWMNDNSKDLRGTYGNLSGASIGAIQRKLLALKSQGGARLFGEPALKFADLVRQDSQGHGVVNLLSGAKLMRDAPRVYAAFLMWLLSELFEELPEVGDPDRPKLVLFFDEAHLLFSNMPTEVLDRLEQVVRLIRSKGVGVYFVTQNAQDLPDDILGQLGLRVAHVMRAYTAKERKAVKLAAENFRNDHNLPVAEMVTQLGVGEALVSALDAKGRPGNVQHAVIVPPASRIGPLRPAERLDLIEGSGMSGQYDQAIDRRSAYEMLSERAELAAQKELESRHEEPEPVRRRQSAAPKRRSRGRGRQRQSIAEAMFKSAARSVGRSIGTKLVRGLLGSLLK